MCWKAGKHGWNGHPGHYHNHGYYAPRYYSNYGYYAPYRYQPYAVPYGGNTFYYNSPGFGVGFTWR